MVSRPRRRTLSRSAYVALHCTCWRRHCSTCKVGSEVCLVGEKSCQACSVVMAGGGWKAGGWAADAVPMRQRLVGCPVAMEER